MQAFQRIQLVLHPSRPLVLEEPQSTWALKPEGSGSPLGVSYSVARSILDTRDFPGGAVVENPPANAGDTGSSPGPGRSHMPRSN